MFDFLIYALGIFRYSMLLHKEDGPWSIIDWFRYKIGIEVSSWNEISSNGDVLVKESREGDGFLAELINCPYCLSLWFAVLAAIGYYFEISLIKLFFLPGALATIPYFLLLMEDWLE